MVKVDFSSIHSPALPPLRPECVNFEITDAYACDEDQA